MSRIVLLVIGFLGGGAVGCGLAFGVFEILSPPPPVVQEDDDAPARATNGPRGKLTERQNRRLDWLLGGSVVGGLIGLATAHFLAKPEEEPPRPPVDFKVGSPPPEQR